jgi:hypothetical protein
MKFHNSTNNNKDGLLQQVEKRPSIIKIYFIPFSLASIRQPPPLLPPINGQLPRV